MNQVYRWALQDNMQVVFEHAPNLHMTYFDLISDKGQYLEIKEQQGWTHLIASLYDRGCQKYNEKEIQKKLFDHQIDLDGIMGNHFLGLEISVPTSAWRDAIILGKEIFNSPVFEEKKIKQEVNVIVEEIEKAEEDAESVLTKTFFEKLFLTHPYARHAWGQKTSLQNANPDNLASFYRQIQAGQKYLNIIGPQNPKEMQSFVEEVFLNKKVAAQSYPSPDFVFTPSTSLSRIETDFQKLYGAYGFPLCEVKNPDRFVLDWISQYWVQAFGGRLFEKIREELGLVYHIDCNNSFLPYGGAMLISFAAEVDAEDQIDQVLQQEIDELCQKKIHAADFEAQQKYLSGSLKIEWDQISHHVSFYNQAQLNHTTLRFEEILEIFLSVSREDIQNVAQKYFTSHTTSVKLVPNSTTI